MNGAGPGEEFISDDELKTLLESWIAPGPSRVLDERIATSFSREFSGADGLSQPELLPHRREEVVSMKFCSKCEEEFADKFSFCPVDGTPLSSVVATSEEPSVTVNREAVTSNPPNSIIASDAGSRTSGDTSVGKTPAYSAAASSASSALARREEFHLTIMDDAGLIQRLAHEVSDVSHEYQLTWPEFKRDPFGFTKRTVIGYGTMMRRFLGNRNVLLAMGVAVLAMLGLVAAVALLDRSQSAGSGRIGLIVFAVIAGGMLVALFSTWLGRERGAAVMGAEPTDSQNAVWGMVSAFAVILLLVGGGTIYGFLHKKTLEEQQRAEELVVQNIIDIPNEQPTPDPGTAGLNKGSGGGSKPKPERPAGGGGGGREDPKPASFGKVPQASLDVPQVVAPDPKPPQIKNPSLPVAATIVADPMLVPPDARVLPYGDFKSKSTDPSSGPGTGNGIGTGQGGGIGPGEGGGLGPGRGGNMGGGDFNAGGGGPGGGGGGDYSKIFTGKDVTSKARLISKPEPQYTEDARKNQIVGTVVLKVVFASSGQVTNIRTVSGLPYGLTERAIAAARQIKFVPATKDGHQVSMWMQLEYNFNLY
jgi:TonB family protein